MHRKITLIIIHCSATPEGKDYTVADIDRWHKARGYNCKGIHIGYHYVIYRDGSIHPGRPEEMQGAHVKDHNAHSIGICYIGGLRLKHSDPPETYIPADTRTPAQKASLLQLLKQLKSRYPNAIIVSHHTFNPQKPCPCFDADHEYLQLSNNQDGSN